MSLRGPRCPKHPSHLLVGVCAFCLRERLAVLVDVECIADAAHNNIIINHINSVKSLPQPSAALHGAQHIINNGPEAIIKHGSKPIVYNGREPKHGSKPITNKGFGEPISINNQEHIITNGLQSIINKDFDEPIYSCGSAAEKSAGRHSFSSARRPNLESIESNMHVPIDIKMPILAIESKMPPLAPVEHTKLAPVETKGFPSASGDINRSSSSSLRGARRSLPFPKPIIEAASRREDAKIQLSDASPTPRHRKKTLSSLFSLDDEEIPAAKPRTEELKNTRSVINVQGNGLSNGSSSAPLLNTLQVKTRERRCRHGSFSERVEPSNYLFPVPEASKPLSWFSSLFRRHKKKPRPKFVETISSLSEHNNGWEDARQSWEAPRPSSWEQLRFSSLEGPRSSWEPARPSWEGFMRTSDGNPVFNGFDFFTESLTEAREDDAELERKGLQELGVDWGNGFADARRIVESKRIGLKSKSVLPKTPVLDDKDRARTFLSAKAMQMQRDASTQTTPPRSSDATEIFIQQRLEHDHHRHRHYARASHAVWSKVWTKTFSNSKWAFKHKHHKGQGSKELGDTSIAIDEAHDQGNNTTSGRSSFHESTTAESTHHHSHLTHFNNIKEHEAWDACHSPVQKSGVIGGVIDDFKVMQQKKRLALKGDTCTQKDENANKNRSSSFTLENGLFRFYLTPARGQGIRGRSKQEIHVL